MALVGSSIVSDRPPLSLWLAAPRRSRLGQEPPRTLLAGASPSLALEWQR